MTHNDTGRSATGQADLRALLDSLPDLAVLGLDVRGCVTSHNRAAEAVFGRAGPELAGAHVSIVYPVTGGDGDGPAQALALAGQSGRHGERRRLRRGETAHFVGEVTVTALRDGAGGLLGYAHVTRDVTEDHEFQRLLAHQALHDPLTGLPNRTLFVDRVRQALLRTARSEDRPVVIFLDLDGFKLVNDSLGHASGDDLLVLVAARLESAVRPGDTIARLGGDEFVVLCEGLEDAGEARRLAERTVAAVGAPARVGAHDVVVQVSAGLAVGDGPETAAEDLLRDADTAMYRAKGRGRGQVDVFEPTMRPRAMERLNAETDLRRALDTGGLVVHYQIVADLQTGEAIGVEALARIAHPDRGLLSPAEFIPLAEETGLILPLGEQVLRTSCEQSTRWPANADGAALLTLVNLSAREVAQPDLPRLVERTLAETGADPARLCLEITEAALVSDARSTARSLLAVRELGVLLAIDDFGTGYSSLAYLHRLPVDMLKIDRSFIEGLGLSGGERSLVRAIMGMAQALGLTVIAEGVEHPRQAETLRELGCRLVQGFGLQRPEPPPAAAHALRRFGRGGALVLRDRPTERHA